ncbi:hypothetical protein DM01DRAFT_264381 [Hesseltinella vesiculosa]|uniref:Uncharacterized protein n=1 Tax=Hesseltinella vesiculosa TaxID=101127 RepID=A0A1X2GKC6_9FUNG|nr:hypothetical protein DM01DRAFT_264381 [Hesseltinella vesiculosa]
MAAHYIVERLLQIPTVKIRQVSATTNKLAKIIKDGRANLHFICGKQMVHDD